MRSNSFSRQNTTSHTPNPIQRPQLQRFAEGKAQPFSDYPSTSFHNLIERYRAQGKYAEMEPLCQHVLEIQEQILGAEHFEVALTLSDLAGACDLQGKYTEAEPLYKRALVIWEKTLGKEHPRVATTLSNLAKLYAVRGNYTQAEQFYLRSLAIQKKTLGPDHPELALTLKNMAELYYRWSLATLLRTAG